MDRQLIAYLIIAAVLVTLLAWFAHARQNTWVRTYKRRMKLEDAAYAKRSSQETAGDA